MVDINGTVAPGFEKVRDAFAANFETQPEVGAGVAVYHRGELVVDLTGGVADPATGRPYDADALQLVFSCTKGVVSVATHLLAQRGDLDLDQPVGEYWPEFKAAGKESITVRQLLSHRAGLPGVDEPLSIPEFLSWDPVVDRLAAQPAAWEPGTAHGYHAVTFGFLVGEVIRRVTGKTVGQFLADEIAGPLGIDFYVGLPESLVPRVAPLIDYPEDTAIDEFFIALMTPGTFTHRAFTNPGVLPSGFNAPEFLMAQIPAANGVTNARSLARIYAATIGEVDGVRLLDAEQVDDARTAQSIGPDLVLVPDEDAIGSGFFLPDPKVPMSGTGAFGHSGLGGSLGFAHPERELAFAYVMNQCLAYPDGDPRTIGLVAAVLECLPA